MNTQIFKSTAPEFFYILETEEEYIDLTQEFLAATTYAKLKRLAKRTYKLSGKKALIPKSALEERIAALGVVAKEEFGFLAHYLN